MRNSNTLLNLKNDEKFSSVLEKLIARPKELKFADKSYILSCAIILLREYEENPSLKSFLELGYYIILQYSLKFRDFEPLYDFSVNFGFYPIAQAITDNHLLECDSLQFSLLQSQIRDEFSDKNLILTKEQKDTKAKFLSESAADICLIAPTSYGKSSLIFDHISKLGKSCRRIGIIVPTKSLLLQTYRYFRSKTLDRKIILHDEMYNNEDNFISILTQERALRLLDRNNISFDVLYIDEAHKLLERDRRSILLLRLIRLNRRRNKDSKIIYLSPLISDANNLKLSQEQNICEQKINFNIKEPEIYEYTKSGEVYIYNRFLNSYVRIGSSSTVFSYIQRYKLKKSFCYLYSPRKIEGFTKDLCDNLKSVPQTSAIREMIESLKKYVHQDFQAITYLRKGVIYLHGKLPDSVKDYLEYKFSKLPELQFIVANKVILEGVNLPIDTLFILSGNNLHKKDLLNLIGRVNRLSHIFTKDPDLSKLLPIIHFVNSEVYNRTNGNLRTIIKKLKTSFFEDSVENPLLVNFDEKSSKGNSKTLESCNKIKEEEAEFFGHPNDEVEILKQKLISLGLNSIYNVTENLCKEINERIKSVNVSGKHYLDSLYDIFVSNLDEFIDDEEFARLSHVEAISYYKLFFQNRSKSLKEKINDYVLYFSKRKERGDTLLYIGKSYGEIPYPSKAKRYASNVYIDIKAKTNAELVNIAIVKYKLEEDFVNYKLRMFFQLMLDYSVISQEDYNLIAYGTNQPNKIQLIKLGLSMHIIDRLDKDKQLENINVNDVGNLIPNENFKKYLSTLDDFYRFSIEKVI